MSDFDAQEKCPHCDEPRLPRRVLLIGGHLDGQWVDVDPSEITHRVLKPMVLDFRHLPPEAAGAGIPMPEFVDYRIERMPIAIRAAHADIWIGTVMDLHGHERDLATARAIFQRDVASLFKEAL